MRTCVGCRRRCSDRDLLRVVAVAGQVVPDIRRRLPGRGAWVHLTPGCVAAARKRRAFDRALRATIGLDVTPVQRFLDGIAATDTTAFGASSTEVRVPGNEVDPS